ncbi:hypothetical protein CesoFtcFv8_020391 [Champsocephalus esox]|uniref:Uncharacterized protein n=2 Tax=Champsocephalus TaxID=52236 RepID=A0AAN8CWB8_CHAGU|nr:hypothetical protein CesoFtcFv8_020391 [Champsocephalus esox]KAK5911697.1 hypothetical protein CgunFtcFv8_005849 [Champsocephalus gunnari]
MLSGCQSGCSSESEPVLARFQVLLTRCTVPQVKGCSWQLQVPTKPPNWPPAQKACCRMPEADKHVRLQRGESSRHTEESSSFLNLLS